MGEPYLQSNLKRARCGWYLYDFGNSILIINGGLYFPQWIVRENNSSDTWYNLVFVTSSIVLLALGPLVGWHADVRGSGLRWLITSSIGLVISGTIVGLTPFMSAGSMRTVLALLGFFAVLLAYQLSLVFYNALLGQLAGPQDAAAVSGRGLAAGWVGGIVGVFLGLPISLGYISTGLKGGVGTILPAALTSAIILIVSIALIRSNLRSDRPRGGGVPRPDPLAGIRGVLELRKNRTVWSFLISFLLFSDSLLTLQNNSTIYMEAVIQLNDSQKAGEFLLVLITSALGAILSAPLTRAVGVKKALELTLGVCVVVTLITPILTDPLTFTAIFCVVGLLNGIVWNISRVLFFQIIPNEKRNTYFGFYASFERFASIIGPLVWSATVAATAGYGSVKYQIAWAGMAGFIAVGLIVLMLSVTYNRPPGTS